MQTNDRRSHRPIRAFACACILTLAGAALSQIPAIGSRSLLAAGAFESDAEILHLLSRITFGPRPGDVDHVRDIGVEAYLERQLHPDRIDDRAVERALSEFETLELETRTVVLDYHLPALMARRARQARQAEAGRQGRPDDRSRGEMDEMEPRGPEMDDPGRRRLGADLSPEMRRGRQVLNELMQQKVIRAVSSERQLQEVLVDFWFNHFNVSAQKGPFIQPYLLEYERDVIRPHVLADFRDLLGAVAESPAMLLYLDNWLSSDPDAHDLWSREATRPGRRGRRFGDRRPTVQPGPRSGLNENYARELLELHTLGVDGGYTQEDVVEVARALTGWTIKPMRTGGGFVFEPRLHVDGPREVIGRRIEASGKATGDAVLDLLARHPSTARHIATKLSARFVADDPPDALVDRTATVFLETDGDLREVMRAILTSPEFHEASRAKVKTPFEFVVSSVRALDGRVTRGPGLILATRELGMPLYICQPPTGYSDRADAWINTGALLARMNFALALAGNRLPGVSVDTSRLDRDDGTEIRDLLRGVVLDHASEATRETLGRATSAREVAVLSIGSPAFQRQ